MDVAVYLFTGFLEAGKTRFVTDTLQDENFNDGVRKYLVISCEEGEEEYDPSLVGDNVSFCSFDSVEDLVPERLEARRKRANADIVVIEYNGMWQLSALYNALPHNWMVYQEIFIADSTTIRSFNLNMRQLVVDKFTSCDMAVFNRTDANTDKNELHRLVRGVSRKADIFYENLAGEMEMDTIPDPLPYDIEAPVVEIKDEDFAVFYRDMVEELDKYEGKCLRFKGIIALDPSLPKGQFAIGRHIMTCCADDIAYRGVVAKWNNSLKLKTRDWLIVKGILKNEYSPLYGEYGPVLDVIDAVRAEKPEQEVATF